MLYIALSNVHEICSDTIIKYSRARLWETKDSNHLCQSRVHLGNKDFMVGSMIKKLQRRVRGNRPSCLHLNSHRSRPSLKLLSHRPLRLWRERGVSRICVLTIKTLFLIWEPRLAMVREWSINILILLSHHNQWLSCESNGCNSCERSGCVVNNGV